jgi:hypothetical protein
MQPGAVETLMEDLTSGFGLREPGTYFVSFSGRLGSIEAEGTEIQFKTPPLRFAVADSPPHTAWPTNVMVSATGPSSQGFLLHLRLPRARFKLGEPIPVEIALQNITATNQMVREAMSGGGYSLQLKRVHGTSHLPLAQVRPRKGEEYGWADRSLPAHGELWYEYHLNDYYNLTAVGDYVLEVRSVTAPPIEYPGRPPIAMPALTGGAVKFTIVD